MHILVVAFSTIFCPFLPFAGLQDGQGRGKEKKEIPFFLADYVQEGQYSAAGKRLRARLQDFNALHYRPHHVGEETIKILAFLFTFV